MKILIIRFSSIGDVLQTLSVPGRLREVFPQAEIHWVTREDFKTIVQRHPAVHKVWTVQKGEGLFSLLKLAKALRSERFSHIYDAHNNLRSRVICASLNGFLGWRRLTHQFLRRSIFRWKRFLLFKFRINNFQMPFSGQRDLLLPLERWGVPFKLPQLPQLHLPGSLKTEVVQRYPTLAKPFIALAPSAAFELKRWPLDYFQSLIEQMSGHQFVVLGGKEDQFLNALERVGPRVLNLAGQLTLEQSAAVVAQSQLLIANDTGLMHVAEQIGIPCIALMGPAPFGFPSRPMTQIMQLDLPCRPCSKHGQGPCINKEYHKCLKGILPGQVVAAAKRVLNA